MYAETKEQCEINPAEMIEEVKAEIAEEKAKRKEGNSPRATLEMGLKETKKRIFVFCGRPESLHK